MSFLQINSLNSVFSRGGGGGNTIITLNASRITATSITITYSGVFDYVNISINSTNYNNITTNSYTLNSLIPNTSYLITVTPYKNGVTGIMKQITTVTNNSLDNDVSLVVYYRFYSQDISNVSILNYKTKNYDSKFKNGGYQDISNAYLQTYISNTISNDNNMYSSINIVSSNLIFNTPLSINISTGCTVTFWIRLNNPSIIGNNQLLFILGSYQDSLMISGYSSQTFTVYNTSGTGYTTGSNVPYESWTHLAYVASTSNLYVYKNGTLNSSTSISGALRSPSSQYLTIGTRFPNPIVSGATNINVNMNHLRVFTRPLTLNEVNTLYSEKI